MVATDPLLALIGFVVFPLVFVINALYSQVMSPRQQRAQQLRAEVSEIAHESFDAALVVKTLGREESETERFNARAGELRDGLIAVGRVRGLFDPLIESLPNLGTLAVLLVGAAPGRRRRDRRRRAGVHRLPVHAPGPAHPRDRLGARRAAARAGRLRPDHPGPRGDRRDAVRAGGRRHGGRRCGTGTARGRLHLRRRRAPGRPRRHLRRRPRAAPSRWSGRPARASPPSPGCWSGSSTPSTGRSCWTASTSAACARARSATRPPSSPSRRSSSTTRCAATSPSVARTRDEDVWAALRVAAADDFVDRPARRPRHPRRRARRVPVRRSAAAPGAGPGHRPPAAAARARRRHQRRRPRRRGPHPRRAAGQRRARRPWWSSPTARRPSRSPTRSSGSSTAGRSRAAATSTCSARCPATPTWCAPTPRPSGVPA